MGAWCDIANEKLSKSIYQSDSGTKCRLGLSIVTDFGQVERTCRLPFQGCINTTYGNGKVTPMNIFTSVTKTPSLIVSDRVLATKMRGISMHEWSKWKGKIICENKHIDWKLLSLRIQQSHCYASQRIKGVLESAVNCFLEGKIFHEGQIGSSPQPMSPRCISSLLLRFWRKLKKLQNLSNRDFLAQFV